jgi:hypothetical protein
MKEEDSMKISVPTQAPSSSREQQLRQAKVPILRTRRRTHRYVNTDVQASEEYDPTSASNSQHKVQDSPSPKTPAHTTHAPKVYETLPEAVSPAEKSDSEESSVGSQRSIRKLQSVASRLGGPLTPIEEMVLSPIDKQVSGRTFELTLQALNAFSMYVVTETESLDRPVRDFIYFILEDLKISIPNKKNKPHHEKSIRSTALFSMLSFVFKLPSPARLERCFNNKRTHKCEEGRICFFLHVSVEALEEDSRITFRQFLTRYIDLVLNHISVGDRAEARIALLRQAVSEVLRAELKGVKV